MPGQSHFSHIRKGKHSVVLLVEAVIVFCRCDVAVVSFAHFPADFSKVFLVEGYPILKAADCLHDFSEQIQAKDAVGCIFSKSDDLLGEQRRRVLKVVEGDCADEGLKGGAVLAGKVVVVVPEGKLLVQSCSFVSVGSTDKQVGHAIILIKADLQTVSTKYSFSSGFGQDQQGTIRQRTINMFGTQLTLFIYIFQCTQRFFENLRQKIMQYDTRSTRSIASLNINKRTFYFECSFDFIILESIFVGLSEQSKISLKINIVEIRKMIGYHQMKPTSSKIKISNEMSSDDSSLTIEMGTDEMGVL